MPGNRVVGGFLGRGQVAFARRSSLIPRVWGGGNDRRDLGVGRERGGFGVGGNIPSKSGGMFAGRLGGGGGRLSVLQTGGIRRMGYGTGVAGVGMV